MDIVVGEVDVAGGQPDRVIAYPATGAGFGAPLVLSASAGPVLDKIGDVDGNGFDDVGVAQLEVHQRTAPALRRRRPDGRRQRRLRRRNLVHRGR
jgi:hypothetical protein